MEVAYSSEILEQTYYHAWYPENPNLNTERNFNLVNFKFEKFVSPP